MDNKTRNIPQKIAKFIKEKRLARGQSQKEFAVDVFGDDKHRQWIGKIENGRGITLDTLDRVFTALDCDIEIIEL